MLFDNIMVDSRFLGNDTCDVLGHSIVHLLSRFNAYIELLNPIGFTLVVSFPRNGESINVWIRIYKDLTI
jgi:hypothetical protein